MAINPSPLEIDSAVILSNPKTGRLDMQFGQGQKKVSLTVPPLAAIRVLNLLLLRLMERPELEVQEGLQTFALQDIEAKLHQGTTPFLQYKMENGLAFATGLEREKMEALHRQLGEILEATRSPDLFG